MEYEGGKGEPNGFLVFATGWVRSEETSDPRRRLDLPPIDGRGPSSAKPPQAFWYALIPWLFAEDQDRQIRSLATLAEREWLGGERRHPSIDPHDLCNTHARLRPVSARCRGRLSATMIGTASLFGSPRSSPGREMSSVRLSVSRGSIIGGWYGGRTDYCHYTFSQSRQEGRGLGGVGINMRGLTVKRDISAMGWDYDLSPISIEAEVPFARTRVLHVRWLLPATEWYLRWIPDLELQSWHA